MCIYLIWYIVELIWSIDMFFSRWTNLNGGEQDMIDCKIGKILIQSRTNLNGGELERINAKERKARRPPYAPLWT